MQSVPAILRFGFVRMLDIHWVSDGVRPKRRIRTSSLWLEVGPTVCRPVLFFGWKRPQLKFRSNPFDTCPFRRTRSAENLGACAAPGRAAARQGQKQPAQESLGRAATFVRPSSSASLPQATPTLLPMEIPAPNAFNNELAQWIANKCTKSIVFVELVPKNAPKLKELWDEVVPLPVHEKAEDNKAAHDERLANCYHNQCSTGSVVKDDEGDLWLLTCAHVLGPVFNNQHPITATAVNRLFNPRIICDHNEQRYKTGLAHNPDLNRTYMRARVVEIDGPRDLMLLFVPQHEVQRCCQDPHPALRMASMFPNRTDRVAMLSWPIEADRTAVLGEVSHHSRPYGSMSDINPCQFQMRLSEIDMRSEQGSSGAPLLNGNADYCGVLHGGNGKFSLFVSHFDLRLVLTAWGII